MKAIFGVILFFTVISCSSRSVRLDSLTDLSESERSEILSRRLDAMIKDVDDYNKAHNCILTP